MPKADWTHLRVRKETADRIRAEAKSLVDFISNNPDRAMEEWEVRDNPNPSFLGMSMDDMLNLLLDNRERHRSRRSKNARGKARRRRVRQVIVRDPESLDVQETGGGQ